VRIRLQTEGDRLTLEIEDNGRGIPEQALSQNRSFGLLGMRERAAMMGGEVQVRSQPGDGTRITARIPLSPSSLAGRVGVGEALPEATAGQSS
jgi:signal transduction histidine kinase